MTDYFLKESMTLEFKRLPEVKPADIIELVSNLQVLKEMPSTKDN